MNLQSSNLLLLLCKKGFSKSLAKELTLQNHIIKDSDNDWVISKTNDISTGAMNFCWPQQILINPAEIKEVSVNSQAQKLLDLFAQTIKNKDIQNNFYLDFIASESVEGLNKRSKAVLDLFQDKLKKRFGRISKIIFKPKVIEPIVLTGFFIYFVDFSRMLVSTKTVFGGQHRVKDDIDAPSRSFLKVEEAYGILGKRPKKGETIVDLGASPGGWTYSGIKAGAKVIAVDHGALVGVCHKHPQIEHIREDAFKFKLERKQQVQWLFCDVVENPYRVLEILKEWLHYKWCKNFIVNLKLGQIDPIIFVERLNQDLISIRPQCSILIARHLYHDRDEITLMGTAK